MSEDITHYYGDGCDAPDGHGAAPGFRAAARAVIATNRDAPTPPRDPAGEGEPCAYSIGDSWGECGHLPDHALHRHVKDCTPGHAPDYICHPYQPPARPSSPTGETPCATCGNTGVVLSANFDGEPIIPCPECRPTGETAGQGVGGAWRRVGELGHGDVHWRNEARDIDAIIPDAVEQAIRAPLEARATAAEAERDRLREALEGAREWLQNGIAYVEYMRAEKRIESAEVDWLDNARRALAGESTEGRE